jgi:hypothetical protein
MYNMNMADTLKKRGKNAKRQNKRGKPFLPGNNFGRGRPSGSRNRSSLILEGLIDGSGEDIVATIIAEAKAGNTTYGKALLDRLVPPRKSTPAPIDIPPITEAADLEGVLIKVANDMAAGDLTPDEAQTITGVIANHIKLHETLTIEERLQKLEDQANGDESTDTPPGVG